MTKSDLEKLQERAGNCFIYMTMVLGDDELGVRRERLALDDEPFFAFLWTSRFTINQKYHIAQLARVSMFGAASVSGGVLCDDWRDMSISVRTKIYEDVRRRISEFEKTAMDMTNAVNMGLFEFVTVSV